MNWNYRIIEHDQSPSSYFAVHEVFYNASGQIKGWTAEPISIVGDNLEDTLRILKTMLTDIINQPVLKESAIILESEKAKKPR